MLLNPNDALKLVDMRDGYMRSSKAILDKVETENRAITSAEKRDFDGLISKIEGMSQRLTDAGYDQSGNFVRKVKSGSSNDAATFMGGGNLGPIENRPFNSFGEQLRAVIEAGSPGHQADQRLYETRAASGANEKVGSEGGFLVQTDYSTDLLAAGMAAAELAPRCRPFPIGPNANGIELPAIDETSRVNGSRFGGLRLYWADEADQFTASKPKFKVVKLKLNKLTGLCYLTDELMQDATALEAFVRQSFTSEYAFVIDDRILRGTGAGQPLGIFNSGALVTVNKEAGQASGTVLLENVTKMYSRMPASSLKNAVWCVNQEVQPQLLTMNIAIGTGGSAVFLPGGSVAGAPYGTLLGRPILPIEQASALGTAGDIAFCDFSRYILADKGQLQAASSMHVRFLYDEQVLRFVYRVDGQPDLASAITPANGTATQSPFVVLQSR